MIRKVLLVAVAFLCLAGARSQAGLIMKLDTSNKTFWLEGSDDVVFNNFHGSGGIVQWTDFTKSVTGDVFYDDDAIWSGTNGTPGPGTLFVPYDTRIVGITGGGFSIALGNSLTGANTVTGNGIAGARSYAALADASGLESLIGSSVSTIFGTAMDLEIQSASSGGVVPEPSSILCFGMLGIAAVAQRRRKQHRGRD